MKLIDTRDHTTIEGELVYTIPGGSQVRDHVMETYYKAPPGHKHYEDLRKPMKSVRYVIQTGEDKFVIIPLNKFWRVEK